MSREEIGESVWGTKWFKRKLARQMVPAKHKGAMESKPMYVMEAKEVQVV